MSLSLGVDGGNTKTIALVADETGAIVGSARVDGVADIYGARSARAALDVVEEAARSAMAGREVGAACFSLAGADWPEDIELLERQLRRRGLAQRPQVVNDAIGALVATLGQGPGVAVVAGTGAATGARGPDGTTWHSSFWQLAQGSRELGSRGLHAVYRAEMGIAPATTLRERVLAELGATSVEEVLHAFTRRRERGARRGTGAGRGTGHSDRPDPGRLARAVLEEAARGDEAARAIVERLGQGLADQAAAAARRVGLGTAPFPLVMAGPLLRDPTGSLAHAFIERARVHLPEATPRGARFEPTVGALLAALHDTGVAETPALIARIEATLPPPALFAT